MTITIIFDAKATPAQYDRAIKELHTAGAAQPAGRLYHCAQPTDHSWCVVEVWASIELFQEFGKTLMPILAGIGIPEPTMRIMPTHNIVRAG